MRLVSLCTPTTPSRRHFLTQSRRYVERQTYPAIEWVIAQGGGPPPVWLTTDWVKDSGIELRFVSVAPGLPVGQMRNHANRAARGDIVLHWDDDDWYGPESVTARVAALTPQVDVVDVSTYHVLYTGAEPHAEPSITWKQNRKGSGNTLGYWRKAWAAQPFTTHIAEDRTFVRKYYNRMVSLRDDSLVIYVRHGGNTCEWPRTGNASTERVKALMGKDFDFYRGI